MGHDPEFTIKCTMTDGENSAENAMLAWLYYSVVTFSTCEMNDLVRVPLTEILAPAVLHQLHPTNPGPNQAPADSRTKALIRGGPLFLVHAHSLGRRHTPKLSYQSLYSHVNRECAFLPSSLPFWLPE